MIYEFKLPDVGEGLHEAEITRWMVKPGDIIRANEPIVEVHTDKSIVELSSPVAGTVASLGGEEGKVIRVGDVLLFIEQGTKALDVHEKEVEEIRETSTSSPRKKRVAAAPTVRKLARELGVNIEEIIGTGPNNRILAEDVRKYSQSKNNISNFNSENSNAEEEIPIRGLRKKISEKMVQSAYTIPHVTIMDEFDVTELVAVRESLIPFAQKYGSKLTYIPFIMKAVTKCLKEYPIFNATIDEEQEKIILKKYYNIGVATDTEDGLLVPVIHDTDQKTIIDIAKELEMTAKNARERKIDVKMLQNGTFTITSVGKYGGAFATPIINYPEVAILGIHAIKQKPAVHHGEIMIREMMGVSLSFDHRIIDGAEAGLFLHEVGNLLEKPQILLLEAR